MEIRALVNLDDKLSCVSLGWRASIGLKAPGRIGLKTLGWVEDNNELGGALWSTST
ncbi:unnamed protein product [Prunus armeniaca]